MPYVESNISDEGIGVGASCPLDLSLLIFIYFMFSRFVGAGSRDSGATNAKSGAGCS